MSEHLPGNTGGTEKGKNDKKFGSRFEDPKTTPRAESIKKISGKEILSFGEGLKPLGESYKPEIAPSMPDAENDPTLAKIEKDQRYRNTERFQEIPDDELRNRADQAATEQLAQQLRTQAAKDAAEQLSHHHVMFEDEKKDATEEDDDDDDVSLPSNVSPKQREHANDVSADAAEFEDIMRHNAPELAEAASGEHLGDDDAEPIGPEAEQTEFSHENEDAFADIANSPELVDLNSQKLPEAPGGKVDELQQPEAFSEWVANEHPELNEPEMSAASNDDEAFNDIVQHSLGGNPPGAANYHEQAPGQPPVNVGGGHNQPPNYPPTAQGGPGGGGGNYNRPNYNFGGNQYGPNQYNNPNVGGNSPNPNVWVNPWTRAGGLTNPNVWAVLGAMQARNTLNNLRHTAREIGLAGAVGILGLGLVAEHMWARRKFKKQKHQINEQGKQLAATNEALLHEHTAHEMTKQRLDRVAAEQTAAANKLNAQNRETANIAAAETGYFAAHKANRFRPETAPVKSTQASEQKTQGINKEEMARYLQNNREAGRAISRNPEMKNNAEFAAAASALGAESVEASTANEKPVFSQEGTHEQLQSQYLDASGTSRASAGTDSIISSSSTPTQAHYDNSSFQNSEQYFGGSPGLQQSKASKYTKPVTAGVGVILLLAAILYFVLL